MKMLQPRVRLIVLRWRRSSNVFYGVFKKVPLLGGYWNPTSLAKTPFHLRSFTTCSIAENLSISGSLTRQPGTLLVEYQVEGALDRICWPSTSGTSGRCHELWRQTCFEFFFSIKDDAAYWEVNLCLNDCWNVYHFSNYRSGMRQEESIDPPLCRVVVDGNLLSFTCALKIDNLIDDSSGVEVGISSVIQATDGSTSYWAIDHCDSKPDFHNRSSFCLNLPKL